jgi:hypothetical protein
VCHDLVDSHPASAPSLCCDTHISNNAVESCEWIDNVGQNLPGARKQNACKTGCPPHLLRMTTDDMGGRCNRDGGARANCCKVNVSDLRFVEDSTMGELDDSLKAFLKDPTCPNPGLLHNPFNRQSPAGLKGEDLFDALFGIQGGIGPLGIGSMGNSQALGVDERPLLNNTIEKRQPRPNYHHVQFLVSWLGNILKMIAREAVLDGVARRQAALWDEAVRVEHENLQLVHIQEIADDWALMQQDPDEAAQAMVCRMAQANQLVGWLREDKRNKALAEERKKQNMALDCNWDHCNREGCPIDYPSGEVFDPDAEIMLEQRSAKGTGNITAYSIFPLTTRRLAWLTMSRSEVSNESLAPLVGGKHPYYVECTLKNGLAVKKKIESRPYPQAGDNGFLLRNPGIFASAIDYLQKTDCNNLAVGIKSTLTGAGYDSKSFLLLLFLGLPATL